MFRFGPRNGEDRVRDWTPGEDRIDLRAFDFASRAEVLALADQVGDAVVLDLSEERRSSRCSTGDSASSGASTSSSERADGGLACAAGGAW